MATSDCLSKTGATLADTRTELDTDDDGAQQLATAVDELINQLEAKFDGVSKEIFGKLDDMARRLDQLEASIAAANDPNQSGA
ncbi:hypothetical protein VTO42DRAFT_1872 [Malbranchea cinnamomea]